MSAGSPFRAALWMTGAVTSFSAMAIAGRAALIDLDTFEILLYRSLFGIGVVVTLGAITGTLRNVQTARLGTHVVRNLFHFTGQNLWFFSLTLIPLAQVFALEFTSPIWAMFLAIPFLGERLTRVRVFAAILGFIGVLIVARPEPATLNIGVLAAAASAIGFAGSAVFTRKLARDEDTISILFWLTVMQAIMGVICAGFDGEITPPSREALPWLAVIGTAGLTAHYCLTAALREAPAAVVMPMDFARLPVIAVIGALFYAEPVDAWVLLGALLIFSGNFANIRAEARRG